MAPPLAQILSEGFGRRRTISGDAAGGNAGRAMVAAMRSRSLIAIACLGLGGLGMSPAAGDSWLGGWLGPAPVRGEEDEPALWRAARAATTAEPLWRYLERFPLG